VGTAPKAVAAIILRWRWQSHIDDYSWQQ